MLNRKSNSETGPLLVIVFARYYNLLIEYVLLLATAVLMPASSRGEFVMYVSVIGLFTLIASVAYEQYGAAHKFKYGDGFDDRNFFTVIVIYTLVVGFLACLFSYLWLDGGALVSIFVGLNIVALNLGKQSLVHFQISRSTSKYFRIFIFYKSLYLCVVVYSAAETFSISLILLLMLVPNILFLYFIGCFDLERYASNVVLQQFFSDFHRIKYLYITAVVTALYSFVDLYIIYSRLDSSLVSSYNLAMQLNMAIAVIGQAYNVHLFSSGNKQKLEAIVASMGGVNILIIGLSLFAIFIVNTDKFSVLLLDILGPEYQNLPEIIRSTIVLLPASLVSMFYVPLWIVSGKYFALMFISISGLALFTGSALILISNGLQGVIHAQYILAIYGLLANLGIYYRVKQSISS